MEAILHMRSGQLRQADVPLEILLGRDMLGAEVNKSDGLGHLIVSHTIN